MSGIDSDEDWNDLLSTRHRFGRQSSEWAERRAAVNNRIWLEDGEGVTPPSARKREFPTWILWLVGAGAFCTACAMYITWCGLMLSPGCKP